jgi:hypothetical protein
MNHPQAKESQRHGAELPASAYPVAHREPPVEQTNYSAADAVSTGLGCDGACAVVVAEVLVIDFISNSAFVAMQTQMDSFWLAAARGREPTTTRRNRTVAKIAKRRIGRPPDGRYGRGVINVPLNNKGE